MNFLYEYMTADEKEIAIAEAKNASEIMKLTHQIESLQMEHAIRISNIDTECLINEYTQDDLENMYLQEMALYTEGVKEWWDGFKKWVSNVVSAIVGKKPEQLPTEGEVTLPFTPSKVNDILEKTKGVIKDIANVQDENGKVSTEKVLTRIGLVAGAATIAEGIKKACQSIKMPVSKAIPEVEGTAKKTAEVGDMVKNINAGTNEKENNNLKGTQSILSAVLSTVEGLIAGAWSAIKTAGGKVKDAVTGKKNEKEDQQTNGDQNANPNENKDSGNGGDSGGQTPQGEGGQGQQGEGDQQEGDKGKKKNALNDLMKRMMADVDMKMGWKALAAARTPQEKRGEYKHMADLGVLETLFSRVPERHKGKARKCINYLRAQGLGKEIKESVEFFLEFFNIYDTEYAVIMEGEDFEDGDIGSSIIESLDDPFNFMEAGLDITGGLKELGELLNDL